MATTAVKVGQLFKDKDPRRTKPRVLKVLAISVGRCELAPVAGGRNTKMAIANLFRRYERLPSTPATVESEPASLDNLSDATFLVEE